MSWEKVGTVTILPGSHTVTGKGTLFASKARVGDGFIDHSGRLYEIENIVSDSVIRLTTPYGGEEVSGASYTIIPVRGYQKISADRLYKVTEHIQYITDTVLGLPEWLKTGAPTPVDAGGTGSNTVVGARANLGLTTGIDLTEIARISEGVEKVKVVDTSYEVEHLDDEGNVTSVELVEQRGVAVVTDLNEFKENLSYTLPNEIQNGPEKPVKYLATFGKIQLAADDNHLSMREIGKEWVEILHLGVLGNSVTKDSSFNITEIESSSIVECNNSEPIEIILDDYFLPPRSGTYACSIIRKDEEVRFVDSEGKDILDQYGTAGITREGIVDVLNFRGEWYVFNRKVEAVKDIKVKGTAQFLREATFAGGVEIEGDSLLKGATTLESELEVKGATTLESELGVKGATTLESELGVKGTTTLESELEVKGVTTFEDNVTLEEELEVKRKADFRDNVTFHNMVNTEGTAVFHSDVHVGGNLFIAGDTSTVQASKLEVEDTHITLNKGEEGAGVTHGSAGIEVDRGSEANYKFEFDEVDDSFKIGKEGNMQDVTTRTGLRNKELTQWDASAKTLVPADLKRDTGVSTISTMSQKGVADALGDGKSHVGWVNVGCGVISSSGTKFQFTLPSEESAYLKGVKYLIPAGEYTFDSVDAPREGYLGFNPETLELYYAGTKPNFANTLLTGWYLKNQSGNLFWPAKETHGPGDSNHHEWAHKNIGAILRSGGFLTIDPATAKATISSPIILEDEDLPIVITHSEEPTQNYEQDLEGVNLPVLRLSSESWAVSNLAGLDCERYAPAGSPSVNDADDEKWLSHIIIFSNNAKLPVVMLLSQDQYDSEGAAIDSTYNFDYLPAPEVVAAWRVVFQKGSFESTHTKHELVKPEVPKSIAVGGGANAHQDLSGRALPDQHTIESITGLEDALKTPSVAEAEGGSSTVARRWTSSLVRQAVNKWWEETSVPASKVSGLGSAATQNIKFSLSGDTLTITTS